jgi:hypothetical protein
MSLERKDATTQVPRACAAEAARSLSRPGRSDDQAIRWDPGRVPCLQSLSANLAFKAGDLAGIGHGFSASIDSAALAGSMAALCHARPYAPGLVVFPLTFRSGRA